MAFGGPRSRPASVPARTPRGTRTPAMTGRRVAWPSLSSPPALTRRTPTKRPTLRLRGDRRTPLVTYAPSLSCAPPLRRCPPATASTYGPATTPSSSTAEAGNPPRPRRPGTRGRVTQSPAGNLIRRLREQRNLRMPKLQQKASGCFRSDTRTGNFAIIRSYLSTLRKQSDDMFNSLVLAFQGHPPMPQE